MPKIGFKFSLESRKRMSASRKGANNGMYGKKHSEETKKKIGTANTNPSKETRIKIGLCHIGKKPFEGMKHSIVSKEKIGSAHRGKKRKPFTEITKQKMREVSTGRRHSLLTREKLSILRTGIPNFKIKGDKHPQWKGGITPINHKIRTSGEYKRYRKSILEKDGYTCQNCLQHGGNLHVDHIKQFAFFPELRFNISNGRTLCVECHKKTDTYGKKK